MGRKNKSITQRKLEVLSARVNFDLYKRIEVVAERKDLTLTQILRMALREWLEQHEEKAA